MFLWFPVLDLARAPRRTARKKGSGYENAGNFNTKGKVFSSTALPTPSPINNNFGKVYTDMFQ